MPLSAPASSAARPLRLFLQWCAALLLLGAGAGCAPSGPALSGPAATSYGPARSPSEAAVAERVRAEVRAWRGTPHVWGGTSRRGVDCSGLVQALYADLFGAALPRTTRAQVREGRRVKAGALQAGDLVFFKTSAKGRHVGIYLEEGTFAHASSSQGVTLSHLDEAYWRRRYWTARRLLDPLGEPPAPRPSAPAAVTERPAPTAPAGKTRSGW